MRGENLNTPKATKSPTVRDLEWAAGFLEGEGNFRFQATSQQVRAAQKSIEPLRRLQSIFGGSLVQRENPGWGTLIWHWCISGARARGVMMTLYSLLSLRRQEQIRSAL